MKTRLVSSALLVASHSGRASSMSSDECNANLGACLVVGTAQTAGDVAVVALVSRFDDHDHNHDKKRRGR
jgi:hypothetical protein